MQMQKDSININEILTNLIGAVMSERKQRRVVDLSPGFYDSLSNAFAFMKDRKENLAQEGKMEAYMETIVLEERLKKEFSYFMQVRMSKLLAYSVYGNASEFHLLTPEISWFNEANQLYQKAIDKITGGSQ